MGTVIGNTATFAFVPVVIAYFGMLFSTQRSGTHADLKQLVTTLALPNAVGADGGGGGTLLVGAHALKSAQLTCQPIDPYR